MRSWLTALDHRFDAAFGAAGNPLKQLGALAFGLLWLLAATGIVLYAMLDTSAGGAYASIEGWSREPGSVGSVLRGLHRYGADAFALVMLAHLAREWLLGRCTGFRRFSWLTGTVLLPLAYACAIGGFWLHWDRLAQFSATATAEWLDALPLFASPLARNFLGGAVSDRLFSLFVFVHLGLPLLLAFASWFHVQRLGHPAVFPRRALAGGTVVVLLLLALAMPVRSQGPADLLTVPPELRLDWLLLFVHPLADAATPAGAWALLAGTIALLVLLPWLRSRPRAPAAEVRPAQCNGCGRCVDDCPFAAITLVPHPSGRGAVAQVRAALCAGCGVCTGACPSSTPMRRAAGSATGIDLPQFPLAALRDELARSARGRDVLFHCACGARPPAAAAASLLAIEVPCAGQLPSSFVDFTLREGARQVVVASCRDGGCEYRLGTRWTERRLRGEREPRLRAGVPPGRWHVLAADRGEEARLRGALEELR